MAIYFLEDSKIDCTGDRNQASLCNFGLYDYLIDRERFIKKGTDILNQNFECLIMEIDFCFVIIVIIYQNYAKKDSYLKASPDWVNISHHSTSYKNIFSGKA